MRLFNVFFYLLALLLFYSLCVMQHDKTELCKVIDDKRYCTSEVHGFILSKSLYLLQISYIFTGFATFDNIKNVCETN